MTNAWRVSEARGSPLRNVAKGRSAWSCFGLLAIDLDRDGRDLAIGAGGCGGDDGTHLELAVAIADSPPAWGCTAPARGGGGYGSQGCGRCCSCRARSWRSTRSACSNITRAVRAGGAIGSGITASAALVTTASSRRSPPAPSTRPAACCRLLHRGHRLIFTARRSSSAPRNDRVRTRCAMIGGSRRRSSLPRHVVLWSPPGAHRRARHRGSRAGSGAAQRGRR